jgi:hypothetical protein
MASYAIDLLLVATFVIGITAIIGVFLNTIGEKVFGRKDRTKFVDKSAEMQVGWKRVGGKGIYRKKTY